MDTDNGALAGIQQQVEGDRIASVAVVTLNWNGWRDTIECLESLQRLTYPNYQVIVVDNGSSDESVERIKAWARGDLFVDSRFLQYDPTNKPVGWVEYEAREALEKPSEVEKDLRSFPPSQRLVLIRNKKNLGVSAGYNAGMQHALSRGYEYAWTLNNDIVVAPDSLAQCMATLAENPQIGTVSCKILEYDDPNRIWFAGGEFHLWRGVVSHLYAGRQDDSHLSGLRITQHVTGCARLARQEVLQEIGLLSEEYFAVLGDADWSARVHSDRRFALAVNLDAVIWHKEGGVSSARARSPVTGYLYTKHRLLLVWRHGSWLEKIAFAVLYSITRPLAFVRLYLTGRRDLVRAQLEALGDFLTGRYGASDAERVQSWMRGQE